MGEFSPTAVDSNLSGVDSNPPKRELTKRTYKPPRLISHGTLRDITLAVGAHTRLDGGFPPRFKTGP
jgi:hypothetical protein